MNQRSGANRLAPKKSIHNIENLFFAQISSSLKYSSLLDSELNRRLANRFNISDFLRYGQERLPEKRLSKIIAFLPDPSESHGQKTFFLRQFLEFIEEEKNWNHIVRHTVRVETEHMTSDGRRIDICVQIDEGEKLFVLAIENKPYAEDQDRQVIDYLNYLSAKSSDFLLIYLSSNGQDPSMLSYPADERGKWEKKFEVVAYAKAGKYDGESQNAEIELSSEAHQDEESQNVKELTAWLEICKEKCEVDKLRWFLSDAMHFCIDTLGNQNSQKDLEANIVQSFLLENPEFLTTARKVNQAWPDIVNQISEDYFSLFAETIQARFSDKESIKIVKRFGLKDDGWIYLRLYSEEWSQCEAGATDQHSSTEGRFCIQSENDRKYRPYMWYVSVRSPLKKDYLSENDKIRFDNIARRIKRRQNGWHPAWKYVDEEKWNWERFLKELLEETVAQEGELLTYYVNFFLDFANYAIPILDDESRIA